ncbi:MAG: OapA N-terminal domain-containing protein [Symbiopectobacterium sp.]
MFYICKHKNTIMCLSVLLVMLLLFDF